MKFLFFFAICSQILPSQQACPENCHQEDGRMVTVKCVENGGTGDCVCQTSNEDQANTVGDCATVTSDTLDATYADFDSVKCKDICEGSVDSICAYWKFTEVLKIF